MKKDIKDLVRISKYAGERFDLVQAGGGNTSVKTGDDSLLIKASGYLLSELNESLGYSLVKTSTTCAILDDPKLLSISEKKEREAKAKDLLTDCILDKSLPRPSIETFFHAFLDKYVIHTHPVVVNVIAAKPDWDKIFSILFPDSICVGYFTPGIDLAVGIKAQSDVYAKNNFGKLPKLIFLKNHGLITASNNLEEVIDLNEMVTRKIESEIGINFDSQRNASILSTFINDNWVSDNKQICYCSNDSHITQALTDNRSIFKKTPFCPDGMVFNGVNAVFIDHKSDLTPIKQYYAKYGLIPKVILFEKHVYIVAPNIKKAREIEEVLKFQIMVITSNGGQYEALGNEELLYLANWEAEKYRQNL